MSNEQLYVSIGVPLLFNGILAIVITTLFGGRLTDLRTSLEARLAGIEGRMATKEELRRVEEVLDARLKHVEEELAKR